jgi:hypothetical protein
MNMCFGKMWTMECLPQGVHSSKHKAWELDDMYYHSQYDALLYMPQILQRAYLVQLPEIAQTNIST